MRCAADDIPSPDKTMALAVQMTESGQIDSPTRIELKQAGKVRWSMHLLSKYQNITWSPSSRFALLEMGRSATVELALLDTHKLKLFDLNLDRINAQIVRRLESSGPSGGVFGGRHGILAVKWTGDTACLLTYLVENIDRAGVAKLDLNAVPLPPKLTVKELVTAGNEAQLSALLQASGESP